jgi:hypothetical protein
MNHWLPKRFVESLDGDALRLLFPPSLFERLRGRKIQKARLRLTAENRQKMAMTVKDTPFFHPNMNDEELLSVYEGIPGAEPVAYERRYAVSATVVCDLAVEIRVVKGGAVHKALLPT